MTSFTVGPVNKIGTFSYSADPNSDYTYPVAFRYSTDLNNDGINEIIFSAFETQPNSPSTFTNSKISIFGWNNNQFVNLTTSLLPNGADLVQGVGDIAFGDFNNDGKVDMYLSGYSDMDMPVRSYTLINQGSYFTKVDMGLTNWEHSATVADINNDGYMDVVVAGYSSPTPYYLGSSNGLVKGDGFSGYNLFGSGIAIADFLGDGTVSAIVVDGAPFGINDTALVSINQDTDGNLYTDYISSLPAPRLEQSNTSTFDNSHDVRVVAFDFTRDGLMDAIVFSRAS